jgi:hypothetical protein
MTLRFEKPDEPHVGDLRRTFWKDTLIAVAVWDGHRWVAPLERWERRLEEQPPRPRLHNKAAVRRKRSV